MTGARAIFSPSNIAKFAAGAVGAGVGEAGLNAIADAVVSAPSEEEARRAVGGDVNIQVAKLMRMGMSPADAERQVNDKVSELIQAHIAKGGVPEWAHAAIGVVGGIGGWALGAKLAGKGLAKLGAKAVAGEAGAGAAKAASLADAAVEDPLKKAAAGAVAEGSGKAAEGAAKPAMGPFPGKPKFSAAQEGGHAAEEVGESAAMNTPMEEIGEKASEAWRFGGTGEQIPAPFPKRRPGEGWRF
jgi:hypothetical protein